MNQVWPHICMVCMGSLGICHLIKLEGGTWGNLLGMAPSLPPFLTPPIPRVAVLLSSRSSKQQTPHFLASNLNDAGGGGQRKRPIGVEFVCMEMQN
jgi:hypothetical protein